MTWTVEFAPEAQKELKKLDRAVRQRVIRFLRKRLAQSENPRSFGAALRGSDLGGFWKYRVGDYRLICQIEDTVVRVLVLRVGHRSHIYKRAFR